MNVTFSVGDTYQSFNVPLNDDNTLEKSEQLEVVIKAIHPIGEQQPIPPVVLGAITVANGTILDDDGKLTECICIIHQLLSFITDFTVMFNASNYSGDEADGVIAVTVVATGELPVLHVYNVTITPSEHAPTSASGLSDFSNDTIVVTFNPGETKQTVLIVINSDCAREGSEFFNLTLSLDPAAMDLGITLGDPRVAVAEIRDTDSKHSINLCIYMAINDDCFFLQSYV